MKVCNVLDETEKSFEQSYIRGRQLSIDETTMKFPGHLNFAIEKNTPLKLIKIKMKFFCVYDSVSSYCLEFVICTC